MARRDVDNHEDPPPPYEALSELRPPPPDGNPAFASGRPNELDAWDFNHAPRRSSHARDTFYDTFDLRDIDEYLADPFAPASEPGRAIIVKGHSELRWYYCHHKVLPAYWRCPRCPPNDCFNRWDMGAMLDTNRHDLPSCSHPNCSATATEETFLVNAQKEDIMTVSGANLMESRAQDSYMWCCRCWSLRGYMANDGNGCAHCADCKQSECRDCVRCNKFLEPTRLCNGNFVYKGVMDLHARAVAMMEGRSLDSIVQFRSHVLDEMPEHLDEGTDFERACRALTLSSACAVLGLVLKLDAISQRAFELRRPPEAALVRPPLTPPPTAREPIFQWPLAQEPLAQEPIVPELIVRRRTLPLSEAFRSLQLEPYLHRRVSTFALYPTHLLHLDLPCRPSLYSRESLTDVVAAEEAREPQPFYERWMRAARYRG